MTIKKNLPLKILVFLLAILSLAGAAMLACCQLYEIDVLWGGQDAASGHQIRRMQSQEFGNIHSMLALERDPDRTPLQDERLAELKERYAAENTNLRWQLRDMEDALLHGNIDGDLPAAAYEGYWYTFSMSVSAYDSWQEYPEGIYTGEETPAQIRDEEWLILLEEAAAAWQAGDRTADPDAVYMGPDGITNLLIIEKYDGMAVYAPTIRSVLEPNADGYQYSLSEIGWIRVTSAQEVRIIMWLDEELSVDDEYKAAVLRLEAMREGRVTLLVITAVLALVWLLLTIYLCVCSGHRKGREGISLFWFHHIPGDLLLVAYFFAGLFLIAFWNEVLWYNGLPLWAMVSIAGLWGGGAAFLLTSLLTTFVARCKGRVVLRHTAIGWVLRGVWRILKAIPLFWGALLGGIAYITLSLILIVNTCWGSSGFLLLWLLITGALLVYLCLWACQWKKLRRGTQTIINTDPDHHIATAGMLPDLKAHADQLNNLGEAISAAVNDRMKSEHFKAELITNVSHDLKTPLTSIINYVDLLKKEDIDNPKAAEYIEVLERKSQRLKKLTEDLVEASKASTGSLTVNRERLDLVQLADQALAEYQDRLESRRLSIVRTLPAEPVWVLADGRHLWRIIDNLLSNCAKYALECTRIYVEVQHFRDCATLSIKNISREELNVDPRALMERFVRGDESRTTEGSGLGLSIAQSLTELQQGDFRIEIDGDLFKATVVLPLAERYDP